MNQKSKRKSDNWRLCYITTCSLYIGGLSYFLFSDWFMSKMHKKGNYSKAQFDTEAMLELKLYILFQNILLTIVFRLSTIKLPWVWKNISKFLQMLLMISCVTGLIVYLGPIYLSDHKSDIGKMITLHDEEIDIIAYDRESSMPWLKILLILSVCVPFFLVFILMCTICIVLCVYLKENFRFQRIFGLNSIREHRPDKDQENEMLRRQFASSGPDHIELIEENDEEGRMYSDTNNAKFKVLDFYIDMMKREVCSGVLPLTDEAEDGQESNVEGYCYPLCEKRFENGDILRTISPCGHVFHEKCIKIWLFKGENQFCPNCRGNIMKQNAQV